MNALPLSSLSPAWILRLPQPLLPRSRFRKWNVSARSMRIPFLPVKRIGQTLGMKIYPPAAPYSTFSVPDIHPTGRSATEMRSIWADRKREFAAGVSLLRDAHFFTHTESVSGQVDATRDHCPRCGCSIFIGTNRMDQDAQIALEDLSCLDCGYLAGTKSYYQTEADRAADVFYEDRHIISEIKQSRSPRLTAQEFIALLALRGDLADLEADKEKLRKLAGTYALLVDGLLPRDLQQFYGFTESENTLRVRADRFLRAARSQQIGD